MTIRFWPTRSRRGVFAAFVGVCFALGMGGCASSGDAALSLKPGVASAEFQVLARRAQAGDKYAQLELGKRYEAGNGVPRSRSRARSLYVAAATDSGGTRLTFVPQRNGSVSAIPVNSGVRIAGLAAAKVALESLDGRRNRPNASSTPSALPSSLLSQNASGSTGAVGNGPGAIFDGSIGSVFLMIVKIEVFSNKCLVRGKTYREDYDRYAEKGWSCLLASRLPDDCTSYPDAILRSVRFVRFHPNFVPLQKSMLGVIEQCLQKYKGSTASAYNEVEHAGMFDVVLDDLGHATKRQKVLVDAFRDSSLVHSSAPMLPGYAFSGAMCLKLIEGQEIENASFWLLFCNNVNETFALRAGRAEEIDKIMRERGLDARSE